MNMHDSPSEDTPHRGPPFKVSDAAILEAMPGTIKQLAAKLPIGANRLYARLDALCTAGLAHIGDWSPAGFQTKPTAIYDVGPGRNMRAPRMGIRNKLPPVDPLTAALFGR